MLSKKSLMEVILSHLFDLQRFYPGFVSTVFKNLLGRLFPDFGQNLDTKPPDIIPT